MMDEDFENLNKELGIYDYPHEAYTTSSSSPYYSPVDAASNLLAAHSQFDETHDSYGIYEDEWGYEEEDPHMDVRDPAALGYHPQWHGIRYEDGDHREESSNYAYSSPSPQQQRASNHEVSDFERQQPIERFPSTSTHLNRNQHVGGRGSANSMDRRPTSLQPRPSERVSHPHNPPVVVDRHQNMSTRLVPVSNLPEPYKKIFLFGVFNVVQSKLLPTIYETDMNVVVTAPTGSGKTVAFELAILRMLEYDPSAKAVYMAPTKSLCSERFQDWTTKFSHLGVKSIELTGDSEHSGLKDAKLANVIVTTPEKWDSMTRKWFDYPKVLSFVRLVCIDEVHMLCEERGSVLEVIVSRMKTLGTRIRFIALSATVPNIQDVAEWLGDGGITKVGTSGESKPGHAQTFIFGEEYRPIKLSKFVYGYPRKKDQTEYQFMSILNFKLLELITTHSSGKPTLIFCGTRKSSLQAAEAISKAYAKLVETRSKLPWQVVKGSRRIVDKKLSSLISQGIGIHHAGLDWQDRKCVEELFRDNSISVLCTTSTLAVGVNLPARSVIIRGTRTYKGGAASGTDGFENYSDLDLTQMMGRAGRPQFDTQGVAVVMTAQSEKTRIEDLVNSKTLLESCLHLNLTEHINSEVNIGTITSHESALRWIRNSFLSIRIQKNPRHYSIGQAPEISGDRQLEEFVERALDLLAKDRLIEEQEGDINPTDLGEIMSRHCLRHKTFLNLLGIKNNSSTRDQLDVISKSEEFSTIRIRAGEGAVYSKLNSHIELKFPLTGKINQGYQKVMLLIQAILGCIPLLELKTDNNNPQMESNMVWQHLPRICKCLVALTIAQRDVGAKTGLELLRSVNAKAWENSPWVLRQLDQIGEKSVKRLTESNISSIDQVRSTDASRIEMILDRNPPFGTRIVKQALSMPKFECAMSTISEDVTPQGVHVTVEIEVGLSPTSPPLWKWKNMILMTTVLVLTSDHQWVEFRSIQVKLLSNPKRFTVECILIKPSQNLVTYVACQQLAGIGCTAKWTPSTPRQDYPKPKAISADDAATADILEGIGIEDLQSSDDEVVRVAPNLKKPNATTKPSNLSTKEFPGQFPIYKRTSTIGEASSNSTDEPGTRLANGRYKCAHKCQGTCQHHCCVNGTAKPSIAHKARQRQNSTLKSSNMAPSASSSAANPTAGAKSSAFDSAKRLKPVRYSDYIAGKKGGTEILDSDSLIANQNAEPPAKVSRDASKPSQSTENFSDGELDHMMLEDEIFLARLDRSLEEDGPLVAPKKTVNKGKLPTSHRSNAAGPSSSSGVSKFKNHKTGVGGFDERAIFRQLEESKKEALTYRNDDRFGHQIVTDDSRPLLPQKRLFNPSSQSPDSSTNDVIIHKAEDKKKVREDSEKLVKPKSSVAQMTHLSDDEEEIDELEQRYDLSIFDPYLASDQDDGTVDASTSQGLRLRSRRSSSDLQNSDYKRAKIDNRDSFPPAFNSPSVDQGNAIDPSQMKDVMYKSSVAGQDHPHQSDEEIDELDEGLAWLQEYREK